MQQLISKDAIRVLTNIVESDIQNNLGSADPSTLLALSILIHAQETSKGLAKLREEIARTATVKKKKRSAKRSVKRSTSNGN